MLEVFVFAAGVIVGFVVSFVFLARNMGEVVGTALKDLMDEGVITRPSDD